MVFCSTDKNKPQGGGEAISDVQKQTQDANVSTLMASISKLQQEKNQLQKEKDELLAKLLATKGRCLYICIELCDFSIYGSARVVNYRHWIFFGMRLFHSPSFA